MTLSLAAAGLLAASSVFDAADARRGGGGGSGGGGHARAGGGSHSMGPRSMGGMRSMGARPMGMRLGTARVHGGGSALREGIHHSHRGRRHAHRHRHRFIGVPLGLYAGYGYYNDYGDGCEWLGQQALYTGSIYWWDRYNACGSGYGY
jgi:hypothetical protein